MITRRDFFRKAAAAGLMWAVPSGAAGAYFMQDKSDVCIVDADDTVAVALLYNPDMAEAPIVVESKMGGAAKYRINALEEMGVPRCENAPLAYLLCSRYKAGDMIAPQFYGSVAEALAYAYRRKESGGN